MILACQSPDSNAACVLVVVVVVIVLDPNTDLPDDFVGGRSSTVGASIAEMSDDRMEISKLDIDNEH